MYQRERPPTPDPDPPLVCTDRTARFPFFLVFLGIHHSLFFIQNSIFLLIVSNFLFIFLYPLWQQGLLLSPVFSLPDKRGGEPVPPLALKQVPRPAPHLAELSPKVRRWPLPLPMVSSIVTITSDFFYYRDLNVVLGWIIPTALGKFLGIILWHSHSSRA